MNEKKETILYKILRPIITFLCTIIFTPKIVGKDKIPKKGKIILAGNHTSIFDCALLISSTKRHIHFLAKKELWNGPKKIIFANMGLIPVDRKNKDHNALVSAEEYLNNDTVIGIFPEGTRNKTKEFLLPFKFGAVSMAQKTNASIVPFGIVGDYKFRSKNLTIIYGKAFKINDMDLENANEKLYKEVENLMREGLKRNETKK